MEQCMEMGFSIAFARLLRPSLCAVKPVDCWTRLPFARWRSCDASTSPMQMRPTTPPSRPHHLLFLYLSLSLTHKHIHTYCLRFISPCQPFGATESSAGWEKERGREGERAYITALGNAEDTLGAQQSEENSDLNGYKLISDRAVEGCRAAPVLKVSRMVQHSIL